MTTEAHHFADQVWNGQLKLAKVPADLEHQVWEVISHRIWLAARALLKEEHIFRPRKLAEYPEPFRPLIQAEADMLRSSGWSWEGDQWLQRPAS